MLLGMSTGIWISLIIGAVALDWVMGDPRGIPHPIVFMGRLIGWLTKGLNQGKHRKAKGLFMWCLVILVTVGVVAALQYLTMTIHMALYLLLNLWLLETTLAEKCLKEEVLKVYDALKAKNLPDARRLTGYLVGRDTSALSEKDIIRATVETTAENTVDGVLAPIFYMVIGCLLWWFVPVLNPTVLAMAYKAVNTMDSMVGYVQEPYTDFGYFPAKLDDVFNFLIARLGSIFMLLGGGLLGYNFMEGQRVFLRDRKNHKSPNSAHPESVTAGLLGIQLGGDNVYFGQVVKKPTIGDKKHPLTPEDIKETTSIVFASEVVMMVGICVVFYLVNIIG